VSWRVGTVTAVRDETSTARTIALDVPDWPGHLAGQHVDLRLTAPDGYTATRSYSIASAVDGARVEVTVQKVPDGEVSPYLTEVLPVGAALELRGPLGGWFVWRPEDPAAVQLLAGGSGVVPLMAMLRTHERSSSSTPVRLLYSVRDPSSVIYHDELRALTDRGPRRLTLAWSRSAPEGSDQPPGRVDAALIAAATLPPADRPACFVCGPTGFVETVADLLVATGHDPARIRTERFGPTGGRG
jgi:ferredoxin-NADP reductase